jgi:hypothetical protein
MKLTQGTKSTVDSQGVKGSSGFSIATSAHMFNILSDGLYSDKIGAVLREIGANAMDAHIMAGKPDLPFEVKLPSRFDSTFHIKDFGPGLDDHEVRHLYTTYGWSNKQGDNDTTGGFGLGSKSPFAYTDSFSICAVKDGIKRVYTAHKDDDGKPVVSLLSEDPADEDWQAGVMVTFPVPPEDVSEFISKASNIFRWFKVEPKVLGAKVDVKKPQFHTKGNNFGMGSDDTRDQSPRVVMANVAYPLNSSRLDSLEPVCSALLSCGIHLFVPTGTVMPTPNREDIQYDKTSKPALAALLKEAAQEVAKEIYARVYEQKSKPWEWHRKIREYAESLPTTIRMSITKFLALVAKDKAELDLMSRLFADEYCDVPAWVGDGRDAPLVTFKKDASGNVIKDKDGAPLYDYDNYDKRGCRVWYYWLDKSSRGQNPVKRKEVINGQTRYASSKEPSPLKVKYTDDVKVLVADATRSDMRIKWMMDEAGKEGTKVLLVQPVRGADVAFATQYAKNLAGTKQGLGGLSIDVVSSIVLPEAVLAKAKAAPRMTLEEKREAFAEDEFLYFSLTDPLNPTQNLAAGDVDEEDKFFVNLREQRGYQTFTNTLDDGTVLSYDMEALTTVCKQIAALRRIEACEGLKGFFVLRGDLVKSLKLREDGWKLALPEIVGLTKNQEWLDKLGKHVDTSPELRLTERHYARYAGYPGILAYHSKKATPFFGQLKRLMPDHPLVLLANRLAAKAQANGGRQVSDVEKIVHKLNEKLDYRQRMEMPGLTRMSEQEVARLANDVYPTLKLLNFEAWCDTADQDAEMAANLFWQFVHLKADSNPDQAKLLQKMAA